MVLINTYLCLGLSLTKNKNWLLAGLIAIPAIALLFFLMSVIFFQTGFKASVYIENNAEEVLQVNTKGVFGENYSIIRIGEKSKIKLGILDKLYINEKKVEQINYPLGIYDIKVNSLQGTLSIDIKKIT